MKNSILIVLLLIANSLFAQDNYPKPFKFNYKSKGTQYNDTSFERSNFVQDSIWLGSQWYAHPKMLNALRMQTNQGTWPDGNINLIPNKTTIPMYHIWETKTPDNARGFQYEPTLFIPLEQRGKLDLAQNKSASIRADTFVFLFFSAVP